MTDNRSATDLAPRAANQSPLNPLSFLKRSAWVCPNKIAIKDDDGDFTYARFYERCRRMASALQSLADRTQRYGIAPVLQPARTARPPPCHPRGRHGDQRAQHPPDAGTAHLILRHGEARALLYDTEFEPLVAEAVEGLDNPPVLVAIAHPSRTRTAWPRMTTQGLIASGEPDIEDIFCGILSEGMAAGLFRSADARLLASLTKALMQDWYLKRHKYRRQEIDVNTYARSVCDLLQSYLQGPS
ncbi:hypothetical protein CDEF62S_03498 [Castellaniella defragrans]